MIQKIQFHTHTRAKMAWFKIGRWCGAKQGVWAMGVAFFSDAELWLDCTVLFHFQNMKIGPIDGAFAVLC